MNSWKEAQDWLDSIVGVMPEYREDPEYRRWIINKNGDILYIFPQCMEIGTRWNAKGNIRWAGFQLSPYGKKKTHEEDHDFFVRLDEVFLTREQAKKCMKTGARSCHA